MPYHRNTNDASSHLEPEAIFPDRPPQFNESTCGYRCGWGCNEPLEMDSDTEPTLVDGSENESTARVDLTRAEDREDRRVSRSRSQSNVGGFDRRPARVQTPSYFRERATFWTSPSSRQQRYPEYDMPGSMENEPSSGYQSRMVSRSRSGEVLSPMSPGPGISGWVTQIPPEYYFVVSPLRLSPQYEHCRGHSGSHMVAQDDVLEIDFMWPTMGWQAPGREFALY